MEVKGQVGKSSLTAQTHSPTYAGDGFDQLRHYWDPVIAAWAVHAALEDIALTGTTAKQHVGF
jgi:hypothetical protein